MALLTALLAAICFAMSSVLQQRAAARAPAASGLGMGLLLGLSRRPVWLLGFVAGAAGMGLQALALSAGQLAAVQPLLVSEMLFALPASALLNGRRPSAREWLYALVVVAGLATFLVSARPGPGARLADGWVLAAAIGIGILVAAIAVALAYGPMPRHRAALLGLAGGVAFGLMSALLKQVVDQFTIAPQRLLTTWPGYLMVTLGLLGTAVVQRGYQAGRLASSLPPLTMAEPLVAVIVGAVAFGEVFATAPTAVVAQVVGFVLMACGVCRLAALTQGTSARGPDDPDSPMGLRTATRHLSEGPTSCP
ncbi:DMT family transporter [Georgenia ruanii]|uniref:DMT family transporter n=1 Tax=Georgenia ruanii TaxID=348442 RepID=UPI001265A501|nr:DMT family transporter [Georgenia ruanii]